MTMAAAPAAYIHESSRRAYLRFGLVGALLGVFFYIFLPASTLTLHWRGLLLAFICGGFTGAVDICYRYRDEPFNATQSPFGLFYVLINGGISITALALLYRYPAILGNSVNDGLRVALTAGFGAMAVMRTKIAVVKGAGGQDIGVGPDYVITGLLKVVDVQVDRFRAAKRQSIVVHHLEDIRKLGNFKLAYEYLLASLYAFQNVDDDLKKSLNQTITDLEKTNVPEDIKYLSVGFLLLTIVGEAHFDTVMKNAAKLQLVSVATG